MVAIAALPFRHRSWLAVQAIGAAHCGQSPCQATVNRLVVGSNPTRGANHFCQKRSPRKSSEVRWRCGGTRAMHLGLGLEVRALSVHAIRLARSSASRRSAVLRRAHQTTRFRRLRPHAIDIADVDLGTDNMMRSVVAAGLVLVWTAAWADNKSDCLDSEDHDLRIKGCSVMIERNPKDVIAYHNRGEAYGLKGDIDHAISDYTKAIVLDPNYAPAYNSRGRAYVSKGDYVRAVDDVTRAGELTHKPVPKPQPWSTAVKGAAQKSKVGQAAKSGLPAPKPEQLPPAGMNAAKPGLAAPKPEALPAAGMAAADKSKQVAKRGLAAPDKSPAVEDPSDGSWPAWAQSKLKN
jgi:hypothetical protein